LPREETTAATKALLPLKSSLSPCFPKKCSILWSESDETENMLYCERRSSSYNACNLED
jgi:hypothetical protein